MTNKNSNIHPTAIIADSAQIGDNAKIGAYCVIGDNVMIGDNCELISHVVINGITKIGSNCRIFPFTSIGFEPQDLKYKGEPSTLEIGDNNTIREYVTINTGTEGGGMKTVIGNNCLFMVGSHIAHDCILGNNIILANNATLAGHVEIGDFSIIGGLAAIHQFVKIGEHAVIGGMSGVEHDVIPYGSVIGERANLAGLNLVGLKRRGFDRETIHALRGAYKMIFDSNETTLADRSRQAENVYKGIDAVKNIISFINNKGSRSLCIPKMQLTASNYNENQE
ncbi:MAG: acyl-ACP--UDP-N-acetylglucosamine O-acyltransferase [Rickettsiales bacterium]